MVEIRLEKMSDDLAFVGDVPTEAEILIQGHGRFLRHRVKGLSVALDMSGAAKGRYVRRLTPADVTVPVDEAVKVVEIVSPPLFTVDLDSVMVKSVHVVPTTEDSPAAGYAVAGSPVVSPEEITIRGAASIVSDIKSLRTEAVSLKGATRMVVARARVDMGGLERVTCDPEQVAVALPVDKVETLTIPAVAVMAEVDNPAWIARWQPEVVEVKLEGPVSLTMGLRDDPPPLVIHAGSLAIGRYFFDLSVDPGGRVSLVSREPERVPSDSVRSGRVVGPPVPTQTITLNVSFDLPRGVTVSEVTPARFHVMLKERGSELEEKGVVLPSS